MGQKSDWPLLGSASRVLLFCDGGTLDEVWVGVGEWIVGGVWIEVAVTLALPDGYVAGKAGCLNEFIRIVAGAGNDEPGVAEGTGAGVFPVTAVVADVDVCAAGLNEC